MVCDANENVNSRLEENNADTSRKVLFVASPLFKRFHTILTVKVIALIVVLISGGYHFNVYLQNGNDSCQRMLSEGNFRESRQMWEPNGCLIHKYTQPQLFRCMRISSSSKDPIRVVFMGDSIVRYLYFEFISGFNAVPIPDNHRHQGYIYDDIKNNAVYIFEWRPHANMDMVNTFQSFVSQPPSRQPSIVIAASVVWTLNQEKSLEAPLNSFKGNLSQIAKIVKSLNNTKVIWMLQGEVNKKNLRPVHKWINNEDIDAYNTAAIKALSGSCQIWSSSRQVARVYVQKSTDGLHHSAEVNYWNAFMIYNMLCNARLKPDDATCCMPVASLTSKQIFAAIVFLLCFIATFVLIIFKGIATFSRSSLDPVSSTIHDPVVGNSTGVFITTTTRPSCCNLQPRDGSMCDSLWTFTTLMVRLGFVMLYFYLCDRTPLFMKERIQYSHLGFLLPLISIGILGICFSRNTDQPTVLNRDQTNEWKGWMQLVLLLYHMTGASEVTPIYMHIRVLVSAYIFLSAFGHFTYFTNKADFSVHRYCTVMVRYNFLVVMLCLVMNKPYMSYYFVPLISFWFTIVQLALAVYPSLPAVSSPNINYADYVYIGIKLLILFFVITMLNQYKSIFNAIFFMFPFRYIFVLADNTLTEWSYRWTLDRYSALYGMLFALGLHIMKKYKQCDDTKGDTLMWGRCATLVANVVSLTALLSYTAFTVSNWYSSKIKYNQVHSYIAIIPILSFLCLRNASGWMLAKYSALFAWFGRISLELFIAQYHVWLAADSHGILVFIPNNPVLNVILTSFVFVCLSHEIHAITSGLLPFIVPSNSKNLCANVLCLIFVIITIFLAGSVF